ncbi:MAG: Type I restriction-modification system, specificity subunit S (EC, partial [uncultured Thiotrichaceae bacterium]
LKQFYSFVEWSGIEGSTIKHLYNRNILNTKIDLPCQKEQTKIGQYFQQLDTLIAQHQQKHDKLLNLKKSLLEKMFPKQGTDEPAIRFKGFSGVWEEKVLGSKIDSIGTGKSFFTTKKEKDEANPYAILGSRSIIGHDCDFDYSGDFVLTARVGENAGQLYRYTGKVKITDNTVFIKGQNLSFIYFLLKNYDLKKLSFGTGQPLIKASELNGLKLSFPVSESEQTKIGKLFQQLDTLITQHQTQLNKLTHIKQACLAKLFV